MWVWGQREWETCSKRRKQKHPASYSSMRLMLSVAAGAFCTAILICLLCYFTTSILSVLTCVDKCIVSLNKVYFFWNPLLCFYRLASHPSFNFNFHFIHYIPLLISFISCFSLFFSLEIWKISLRQRWHWINCWLKWMVSNRTRASSLSQPPIMLSHSTQP